MGFFKKCWVRLPLVVFLAVPAFFLLTDEIISRANGWFGNEWVLYVV